MRPNASADNGCARSISRISAPMTSCEVVIFMMMFTVRSKNLSCQVLPIVKAAQFDCCQSINQGCTDSSAGSKFCSPPECAAVLDYRARHLYCRGYHEPLPLLKGYVDHEKSSCWHSGNGFPLT